MTTGDMLVVVSALEEALSREGPYKRCPVVDCIYNEEVYCIFRDCPRDEAANRCNKDTPFWQNVKGKKVMEKEKRRQRAEELKWLDKNGWPRVDSNGRDMRLSI